jgi:serine/threonine protein kinase
MSGLIADDLDAAAKAIVKEAFDRGSPDNLTVQIVRIDELPDGAMDEVLGQATELPLPPLLEPRMEFDGYKIVRQIHASSRSHIYLASDQDDGAIVALKIPSIDLRQDQEYIRRFLMEEWIARRIDNAHILKSRPAMRDRKFIYSVTEFIEGQTLTQWITDHPAPDLEAVRGIVEQIATGLQAFHRLEMVHQDLRPENIMIDTMGTVKIIDFGSTKVAGVSEATPIADGVLGTVQYTAPEYLLGDGGTTTSDIFSLGVIAYQMLTGKLPYGAQMAQARTRAQQRKIPYVSARTGNRSVPEWVDLTLRKAVHPDPHQRYQALSEFAYDLRHPNPAFVDAEPLPLIERNPLVFWQVLSAILACVVLLLLLYPVRH